MYMFTETVDAVDDVTRLAGVCHLIMAISQLVKVMSCILACINVT
jgi:hypothetical protein